MDVSSTEGNHAVQNNPPTPREQILAAYEWTVGACFRCGRVGCSVAVIGHLVQMESSLPVRACEECVIRMEREREAAANRYGWPYTPGTPNPS